LAKLKGADVIDKFSGKVDLMVVGSEPGSKLADAQRKGIALIDEKQFITILR
jgi:DNA ligase (NAD+)